MPFSFGSSLTGAFVSQFQFVDASIGWAMLSYPSGNAALLKTTSGGRTWINLNQNWASDGVANENKDRVR